MASSKRVIQISGIKNRTQKQKVVEGIRSLGGKYIGGSVSKMQDNQWHM